MNRMTILGVLLAGASVQGAPFQTPQYKMDGFWARWNGDGSRIVFLLDTTYSTFGRPNVFTSDADGSGVTQITFFRGNEAFGQHGSGSGPTYRPGTSDVFWRDDRDGAWFMAYAADDGSTGRTRTTLSGHNTPVRFSPDGTRWVYADYLNYNNTRVRVGSGGVSGSSSTISQLSGVYEVEWGMGSRSETLAMTRLTAQTNGLSSLYLIDADGTDLMRLTDDAFGNVRNAAWAPDGESIFFVRELNGQSDIWSIEIDTGDVRQWTNDSLVQEFPTISPDGTQLMYSVRFWEESQSVMVSRLYTLDLTYIPGPGTVALGLLGVGACGQRRRR